LVPQWRCLFHSSGQEDISGRIGQHNDGNQNGKTTVIEAIINPLKKVSSSLLSFTSLLAG
jgi:hypothetical protein